MADKIDVVSSFCVSCPLPHCPDKGRGCPDWREWYINWWNRNVCNPPDSTDTPEVET